MSLFHQFVQTVNKEYDRRIRRASEIIEYGMGHGHGHGHGPEHEHDHGQGSHQDEDEATAASVEISNIPPGTRVPDDASRASDHHA
ncbi:MAG: hypothetical protein HC884_05375 [Chloroflexaceae bacterium]|nr:hypothetical protein [Chloroflexaceae bacterium]